MKALQLSRMRKEASRNAYFANMIDQARQEDANRVYSGQFVSVNADTREVRVRLFSGQIVTFGLDFLGSGILVNDPVQITFARGASRAIVVSKP